MAAAVSMLSATYDPKVYDSLGEIQDVDKLVVEEQIHLLGSIILKYGHGSGVSVIKAHRHFDLAGWEVMAESEKGDGTAGSITTPIPLEEAAKLGAVPNVVALGGSGGSGQLQWFPVNYALGTKGVPAAWSDSAFLREAADYLAANGLSQLLMLGTVHGDAKALAEQGQLLLEINYHDTRISDVGVVSDVPAGNSIATTYTFTAGQPGKGGVNTTVMRECNHCWICWR